MDKSVIRSKDLVQLRVDSVGLMATPPLDEPLPEGSETVSHLRLLPTASTTDYSRCVFRIETEFIQVTLLFASASVS